jgi:nucleoside-diphosphate-sugar epimerase
MRRYVVTGGAGFIGSALVRKLLLAGDGSVLVIDNLFTGREENLAEVRSQIEFDRSDIRDYKSIAEAMAGADVVFHLAAIPSVPRSIQSPVLSHEVNIDGSFNVFRACQDGNVRRVVYAASSSAYGDTTTLPKVESMAPRPNSPYAAQKLAGEYYASVFNSCFGLETVSLRFFNVYGERQDPSSPYSGVVSLFMKALIDRRSPTIFGDGEQTRDWTYVDDVAALCVRAAQAEGVAGKVYNAGNGERYSLNYVWRLLQEIGGVPLAPRYDPPRAGDVRDSQADTGAARRDIGHQPRYSLEQGLRRTLAWYRSQ